MRVAKNIIYTEWGFYSMGFNSNDKNINDLIRKASQTSGVDANTLKNNVDSGKLDEIVSKLNPQDAKRFQQIMNNPQMAQNLLNTPQAQALIKKFMGK